MIEWRIDTQTRDQEEMQNKLINEEYKIWKKNSVFLYDIMYRLVSQSLTMHTARGSR